jgi:riboflavin synthase alpha subunit
VRTGETSGVGITVYQNEKARLAGHEIRKKGLQTNIFSKHLKDTVVLEGDVLIQFGENIIDKEN